MSPTQGNDEEAAPLQKARRPLRTRSPLTSAEPAPPEALRALVTGTWRHGGARRNREDSAGSGAHILAKRTG